jgi:hypothetical protein
MKEAREFFLFSLLFLVACNSFAAYPLATDDAGIVKKGSYEFETGYDNCKDQNDLVNRSCGVSFKYGAAERMDIGISFPYQIEPEVDEKFGSAALAFKFSFIKNIFAVSFSNELGEKDYFINGIYTKEFSFVECSLNAGYLSTGDETVKGAGSYGLSVSAPVNSFDIVGEIQGQEGGTCDGLIGVRYHITDSLFIASAVSREFTSNSDRLTGGFHFEF